MHPLARTFSIHQADELFEKIGNISHKARLYLEQIPANQWRSTTWLEDTGLPPRYGIVTSNMSESMNNMFEKARDGSWLQSVDSILGTMFKRISSIRTENTGRAGIIKKVVVQIKDQWDKYVRYCPIPG